MEARRLTTLILSLALLGGCGGEETKPPPGPPPKPEVLDAGTSDRIDQALEFLNNNNREERNRNELIACGLSGDLGRRAVIERTAASVKRSYATPQGGPHILSSSGRRRAIEALDKVGGADPQALEIFKLGAQETNAEVASAAGAALAARGDESAFATLLAAIKLARNDREVQNRAAAGLVKLAKPERKDEVLAAVEASSRDALAAVVSACLPPEGDDRAKALASIVKENPNPQARIVALEELRKAGDQEIVDFAKSQATAEDADLRAYSLRLIASQGGKVAAFNLRDVLASDPKDPAEVAKVLATVDAPETVVYACELVTDGSRAAATRAACARHVLGRVRDDRAPASLRDAAAQERALGVLRRAIRDRSDEVAKAAVDALGRAGDASDAEALGVLLADSPQHGEEIVKALGRLGGPTAMSRLIEGHQMEKKLRAACRDALVASKGLRDITYDQGRLLILQLKSDDLDLRKSAIAVLKALKGDSDVLDYAPEGDADVRSRSTERWIKWWKEKKLPGGGG